jgi:hypothetical protein
MLFKESKIMNCVDWRDFYADYYKNAFQAGTKITVYELSFKKE